MEMYDMKPEAPLENRGEFLPIATNVGGLDVCELMPMHAQTAHRYNIVRSIAHTFSDHGGGHKRFLTGRDPKEPTGFVNDYPMVGSVVAKKRQEIQAGVPNYICASARMGIDTFSFGPAYLGTGTTPFMFDGDPSDAKFKVKNLEVSNDIANRLDDRMKLLSGFDRLRRTVDRNGMMSAMDQFNQEALSLLTSDRIRKAFDLSEDCLLYTSPSRRD